MFQRISSSKGRSGVYRVYLNATAEFPRAEEWLDAVTVCESQSEMDWEFRDAEGLVVRRFEKAKVRRFERTADRREPRHLTLVTATAKPRDVVWDARIHDRSGSGPLPFL